MNLQEFIESALTEIVAGVGKASESAKTHGGSIGAMELYGHVRENKILTDAKGRPVVMVEFDIALADANSKDTKGGIGVYLGAVGLGSHGTSRDEASTHSRIKFSVPVVLPDAKA